MISSPIIVAFHSSLLEHNATNVGVLCTKLDLGGTSIEADEMVFDVDFETDPTDGQTKQFTEEYAISINERILKDSLFRSQMQATWGEAARSQYQSIYDRIP